MLFTTGTVSELFNYTLFTLHCILVNGPFTKVSVKSIVNQSLSVGGWPSVFVLLNKAH